MNKKDITKGFLPALDPESPDAERAEILESALDGCIKAASEAGAAPGLTNEDTHLLLGYARGAGPDVRALAVDFLASYGPCSWDDLEIWAQDSDEIVRQNAFARMDNGFWAAGRLCNADTERCGNLLVEVIAKYIDYTAANLMDSLRKQSDEWLEATWSAAEEILDLKRPELTLMLTCCYLERLIPESEWGPDDLHIREWIEGDDSERKLALLKIANYRGIDEGRMADIVDALQSDPNEQIAALADGILNERIEIGALWASDDADMVEEEEDEEFDDLEE